MDKRVFVTFTLTNSEKRNTIGIDVKSAVAGKVTTRTFSNRPPSPLEHAPAKLLLFIRASRQPYNSPLPHYTDNLSRRNKELGGFLILFHSRRHSFKLRTLDDSLDLTTKKRSQKPLAIRGNSPA